MLLISADVFNTSLPSELVNTIWNGGFLDFDVCDISADVRDTLHDNFYFIESWKKLLHELHSALKDFSVEQCANLWNSIATNGDMGKQIMTTLAYFMDCCKQETLTVYMKESSILAANVYITMLRLPGYTCIQLFHPTLFQKSIDALKNISPIESVFAKHGGRSKHSKLSSSQGTQKSSQSSQRREAGRSQSSILEDSHQELELSEPDIYKLRRHLVQLLQSLVMFLKINPLKKELHLSELVIALLSTLTSIEPSSMPTAFDPEVIVSRVTSIAYLAYLGIHIICMRNPGGSVAMIKCAFKSLEQNFLMLVGQKRDTPATNTIPRDVVLIRDLTLAFVVHLVREAKDSIKQPLQRLVSSVILSAPDRSEYRVKISQAVLVIMEEMGDAAYCDMCKWLFQLSKYKKASGRIMAAEIYGQMLVKKDLKKISDTSIDLDLINYTTRFVLLQALLTRCSDKVPSVCAKSLSMLALCLNCKENEVKKYVRSFITTRLHHRMLRPHTTMSRTSGFSVNSNGPNESEAVRIHPIHSAQTTNAWTSEGSQLGPSSIFIPYSCTKSATMFYLTRGFDITLTDSDGLVSMVTRRMKSSRAVVRRSALVVLESIIIYNDCMEMSKELGIIKEHCRDLAVPIRKQAIQSLAHLLQLYPNNSDVLLAWLTGVLPCHDDNESSVQEKCWHSVKSVIFENIPASAGTSSAQETLVWKLCSMVNTEKLSALRNMLHSICVHLHKTCNLPTNIVHSLSQYIDTEHSKEAWMLLSITCPVLSTFGGSASDIVASQWLENSSNMDQSVKMFVLTTITSLARHMSSSNRNKIIRYLITELKTYRVSLSTIKYMVVALSQLMEAEGSDSSWVKDMATEIETFLSDIVYGDQYDEQYVSKMPHYLITLGEVCLHNPIAISNKLIQIIQCLLITPKVQEKGTGVLDERKQPKFISDLAEGLLPAYLRRATVHCIGQMCLQHEQLAKQTIPVLARELELSTDSVIKKTAVTIICDLCKLYTNAVGPYISSISSCLKDKDPGVNKTTFISLTRLLQEDFLKWRGSLFYRFISCIVSEDADVAELAKVTFIHELSKRHKGMYTQHFVECLFHFNDYTGHKSYNRFPQTESERKLFSLAGEDNSEKRHSIYCFMLEYMTDSQKFSTTEKLCQDVLSAAVEKTLPLNSEQPAAILIDALSILQSKNIKLSITKASTEALIDGLEEMTPSQATTAKAATVQVTKLLKKSFVETVIPDIISLKSLLEANHSPMIKHLMLFLIELTKDYKAELADLLAGNEQLSAELAFDIRKFEEKEAAAAAETVAHEAVHTATPTVERQAQCATTPFNTTSNAAAAHAASIPHTPASQPLSGTPRRTALGGTPAMPPPPLRSAMKKPEHSSTHLLRSAKKLARDREKLKGSQQVMSRKVNFNEDEENEEPEPCESSFSGVPSTPLLDIASAAVGARAISTPDGTFADVTFAANMSIVQKNSSPGHRAVGANRDDNPKTSSSRVSLENIPSCPLTGWKKIKSPVQKNKRCRPPPPVDISDLPVDTLGSLSSHSRTSIGRQSLRSGRKRK